MYCSKVRSLVQGLTHLPYRNLATLHQPTTFFSVSSKACSANLTRTLVTQNYAAVNTSSTHRQPGSSLSVDHPLLGRISSRNAGHSKWSNIRHIKGAKDAQKAKSADKFAKMIKMAVREGGSPDPKLNSRLASVMNQAFNNNIPKSTVENSIKAATKSASAGKTVFLEMMGPGNCLLVAEAISEKPHHLRQTTTGFLKKFGGRLGDSGFVSHSFDYKGVVQVSLEEGEEFDLDAATELAIEAGAEDVSQATEDEQSLLQFICDPKEVHMVKKSLEGMNKTVTAARFAYIPHTFIPLNKEQLMLVDKLVNALEDWEEIVRIYDNIEVMDS